MDPFAQRLLAWHDRFGRKDLPWQQDINPYRVWLSEIMLQQTQVATVIDYFERFVGRFPTVAHLAQAELDEVLHLWTGLGYYARARNLHKTAISVVSEHNGNFPATQEALEALPGIGRSTAGAIRAIAMGQQATILDGNVKRVLTRYHALAGYPGTASVTNQLWSYAEAHTPNERTGTYTQAIMDLGATLCRRRKPACSNCPVGDTCEAHIQGATDRYPEPKPKKQKPVRSARFFVVSLPGGATLLEQRPQDGIWGGLWTPPQRDSATAPDRFLADLGVADEAIEHTHFAPVFRHTFTHFHLDIEPVYIRLNTRSSAPLDSNDKWRWVVPDQIESSNERIGLSAPAVKLLASLQPVFEES